MKWRLQAKKSSYKHIDACFRKRFLTDIYMLQMNGFELYQKIVEIDANIRVCFMSAAEVNIEALGLLYQKTSYNRLFG